MMYSRFNFLVFCFFVVTLSGCAFGPFVSHETARTVGESNTEFAAGYGQAGYVFKGTYGVMDDLDIGVHIETLSIGVRAKYAFINNKQEGLSFAGALGVGNSIGGDHYYADVMASYLTNSWEPYGLLRFVHVNVDDYDSDSSSSSFLDLSVDAYNYQYGQFSLGTRYWFSERVYLSLEGSTLFASATGLSFNNPTFFGLALGIK